MPANTNHFQSSSKSHDWHTDKSMTQTQLAETLFCFERQFFYVAKPGLKLLRSSNLPTAGPSRTRTKGMHHHAGSRVTSTSDQTEILRASAAAPGLCGCGAQAAKGTTQWVGRDVRC